MEVSWLYPTEYSPHVVLIASRWPLEVILSQWRKLVAAASDSFQGCKKLKPDWDQGAAINFCVSIIIKLHAQQLGNPMRKEGPSM